MLLHERIDTVIRWLGIALFGLIPFFVVPVPWVALASSKMLLIGSVLGLIGLLWFIARFTEGEMRVPAHALIIAALLVPAAYVISAWASGLTSVSMIGSGIDIDTVAFIALCALSLIIFASLFSSHPRGVSAMLRALMLGGIVVSALQLVHLLAPSFTFFGTMLGQTGNAFGAWREFAMFMGLLFFLGVSLTYSPVTRGYWKYVAMFLALLSGVLLVIANYPDVTTLVFIGVLFLLLARGYRSRSLGTLSFWRGEWVLLVVAVLAAILLAFGTTIANHLPERLRVVQTEVRPSWQATYLIAKQTIARPTALLVGTGPNTFTREWGLHKPLDVNSTPFWNIDFNVGVAPVPTSFITLGLMGSIAWVVFIGAALYLMVRTLFFSAESPVLSLSVPLAIAGAYLLSLQLFTIPGMTMSVLLYLFLGLLLAALVPLYVREREIPLGTRGVVSWVAMAVVAVLAAAVLCAGIAMVRVNVAEAYVARGIITYNQTQNIERSSHYIAQALKVYPNDDHAHRIAVQLGFLSLQQLMTAGQNASVERLQETLKDTIQHGLDAVSINGDNYQNWLFLAGLYAELAGSNIPGASEKAREAYERAREENPTSPVPYVNLAQLELMQNKSDDALAHLQKAVQLKPDFATAYYLASQIYAARQDYANALPTAAAAAQYASGDPEAWYNLGAIAYVAADYPDAISALRQALAIQSKFANALYVLALAYYQSGDTAQALAQFEALDQLDPGKAIVQEAIANLREGKPLPSDGVPTPSAPAQ